MFDVEELAETFYEERERFVRAGFQRARKARLSIGRFRRNGKRNVALCDVDDCNVILHADALGDLSWNQVVALVRHELAHVADPDLSEADTDLLAEEVSGAPIRYGADDIQTIGRGVRPRPARLPR